MEKVFSLSELVLDEKGMFVNTNVLTVRKTKKEVLDLLYFYCEKDKYPFEKKFKSEYKIEYTVKKSNGLYYTYSIEKNLLP